MNKLKWYWFIPIVGIVFIHKVNEYSINRYIGNIDDKTIDIWTVIQIISLIAVLVPLT